MKKKSKRRIYALCYHCRDGLPKQVIWVEETRYALSCGHKVGLDQRVKKRRSK